MELESFRAQYQLATLMTTLGGLGGGRTPPLGVMPEASDDRRTLMEKGDSEVC